MRPRDEIRKALGRSAWDLASQRADSLPLQPPHWREISAHAKVGRAAARMTIKNMVRAGELVCVGKVRVEGVCRPLSAYMPAEMVERSKPAAELTAAVNCWARAL